MSLLNEPKNRRFARLFEFQRQKALAETALMRLQSRRFQGASEAESEAFREVAARSLTRLR